MKSLNLPSDAVQPRKSTPEIIADALRDAILHGDLPAEQPLRLDEIAAQFKVSRIPVREALKQLEAEGLVTLYPYRGAVVAPLSIDEAQEIYEMRGALETLALRLAIPNMTEETLQRADTLLTALDQEANIARWGEFNQEFHITLYTPAHRPRLLTLIKNLHNNVDRYMRLELTVMKHQALSQYEHRQLLAACRSKETAAAVRILEDHITNGRELLVAYLKTVQTQI